MNSEGTDTSPAIVFDGVSKAYNLGRNLSTFGNFVGQLKNGTVGKKHFKPEPFKALNNLSFTINHGERVGFIGGNGAGKSTVLKLIQGVTFPSSGDITVKGKVGGLIELGAAFVPNFSARENILLSCAMQGIPRSKAKEKVHEIAEIAEISKFLDVPLSRFSSGMKVRLGFVVSMMTVPDIILLDEVLAVGDESFKRKSINMLEDYLAGRTIIFVSHSMNLVKKICDRCIYLKDGAVQYDGAPEMAINSYLDGSSEEGKIEKLIAIPTRVGNPVECSVKLNGVKTRYDSERLVLQAEIDIEVIAPSGFLCIEISIYRKSVGALVNLIGGKTIKFPNVIDKGKHQLICEFDTSVLTEMTYLLGVKPYFSGQSAKAAQEHTQIEFQLPDHAKPGIIGSIDLGISCKRFSDPRKTDGVFSELESPGNGAHRGNRLVVPAVTSK